MICLLVACIPFFFDGVLSLISLGRKHVLTGSKKSKASSDEIEVEDDFQKQENRPINPSEVLIPELIHNNPDLGHRLTTDWKESAYNGDY